MPQTITLQSGLQVRLGRNASDKHDLGTRLFLRDFLAAPSHILLPERQTIDWHAAAAEKCPVNGLDDILGNDRYGDCAWAAPGHVIQLATACESGLSAQVTAGEITREYFNYTGGRDTGSNLLDVLKIWQKTGICGYKISAYVAIEPADEDLLRWACDYLGGLYVACNLPSGWEQQQTLWDARAGRIIGGHAVVFSGYTDRGPILETWGLKVQATWAGWRQYFDEAYAVILDAWTAGGTRPSPAGLDLDAIRQQVAALQAA